MTRRFFLGMMCVCMSLMPFMVRDAEAQSVRDRLRQARQNEGQTPLQKLGDSPANSDNLLSKPAQKTPSVKKEDFAAFSKGDSKDVHRKMLAYLSALPGVTVNTDAGSAHFASQSFGQALFKLNGQYHWAVKFRTPAPLGDLYFSIIMRRGVRFLAIG
jgi:hypothetical protein